MLLLNSNSFYAGNTIIPNSIKGFKILGALYSTAASNGLGPLLMSDYKILNKTLQGSRNIYDKKY